MPTRWGPRERTRAVLEQLRATGHVTPPAGKLPPQKQPDHIRLDYWRAILPVCDLARQAFKQVEPRILDLLGQRRKDAEPTERDIAVYGGLLAICRDLGVGDVTLTELLQTAVGPQIVLDLPGDPYIVVCTGQHGEERAGAAMVMEQGELLFDLARRSGVGLRLYPCVNPEGYSEDKRRDLAGDTHANSFLEFLLPDGSWVGELEPGQKFDDARRPLQQASETASFYDDLTAFAATRKVAAVLDFHEDCILPPDYAFAYVNEGHDAFYTKTLKRSAIPFRTVKLENASWSQVELSTDRRGLVVGFRDGSVTDWADEFGIPYSVCVETPIPKPFDAAISCYMTWVRETIAAVADNGLHRDASDPLHEEAQKLIAKAKRTFAEAYQPRELEAVAAKYGQQTVDFQREQLDEQVREAIGVDTGLFVASLSRPLDTFIEENVSLITSVPERYFDRLSGDIEEAFMRGQRPEDLTDDLEERYGMSERDAARIARDQIGKLYSQANEDRQKDLGVERFIWRASGDNRICDDCEALDGEEFSYAEPPPEGLPSEAHPECFPGGIRARLLNAGISKIYRRRYSGPMIGLMTDAGSLHSTPNHPILTDAGWKAPHLIEIGEYVFEAPSQSGELFVIDPECRDPMIEEIFRAGGSVGTLHRILAHTGGFHGDATDEEIDVIDMDRCLGFELDPAISQRFCQNILTSPDLLRLASSPAYDGFLPLGDATHRISNPTSAFLAFIGSHVPGSLEHCLTAIAWLDAIAYQLATDGCAIDAEAIRECLHAHPLGMELHHHLARIVFGIWRRAVDSSPCDNAPSAEALGEIVRVAGKSAGGFSKGHPIVHHPRRVLQKIVGEYSGHVYNLETSCGWYVAQNLLVGNCRCYAEPVLADLLASLEE